MGEHVRAGDVDVWTEQVGHGSDVLLIGGLGDTVESWQFQLEGLADRYRLTAFDNRGAGRTALPDGELSAGRWPTTPRSSCGHRRSRAPTSPGSRWEAPSRKSWRCDIHSSSAAWCS